MVSPRAVGGQFSCCNLIVMGILMLLDVQCLEFFPRSEIKFMPAECQLTREMFTLIRRLVRKLDS